MTLTNKSVSYIIMRSKHIQPTEEAMLATTVRPITPEQYTVLMQPVRPPPEELFELQRQRLADEKLAPVEMFDHFASRLPPHGLFLLVPPQPGSPDSLNWGELMAR